jgi:tetratricopeptide (TPR) repeat protein
LIYLKNAEKLDNNNPMIKYQKANILFNNKRDDEALQILLELNEKRPKEAPIHILIGRIYKTKKEFTKALNHFNAAIDIDPKDSNLAKSLIEKLYTESDEQ